MAALGHVRFVTDIGELADRQLVVEAVREFEDEKLDVFRNLGKIVDRRGRDLGVEHVVDPDHEAAVASERPEHVVGLHFFNPVPVMRLVELIPSHRHQRRRRRPRRGLHGRRPGQAGDPLAGPRRVHRERVVRAYVLAAIRMLESGFASADDIDAGMVEGCSHPMGPLALADMIGLDTIEAVADSMYAEFKEPLYAPPPLLSRMVEAGLLGRKCGRGFFNYTK